VTNLPLAPYLENPVIFYIIILKKEVGNEKRARTPYDFCFFFIQKQKIIRRQSRNDGKF